MTNFQRVLSIAAVGAVGIAVGLFADRIYRPHPHFNADATCAAVGGHKYTVVLTDASGTPVVVPLDLTLVAGGFKHNAKIGGVYVDFSDQCSDATIDGLPVAVFLGKSQQGAAIAEWVFAPAVDGNPAMYEVYDDGRVGNSPTAGNSGVAFVVQQGK